MKKVHTEKSFFTSLVLFLSKTLQRTYFADEEDVISPAAQKIMSDPIQRADLMKKLEQLRKGEIQKVTVGKDKIEVFAM